MCLSNMAIGKMNWWYLENAVVHFLRWNSLSGAYDMAKSVVVYIFAI